MRCRLAILIALAAVVAAGCSDDTPTAPVGSVSFVPDQSSFSQQDDFTATITNRTARTIFVENRCPAPNLEIYDGTQWQLAQILNKYPDTAVLIEGHTDNTGTDEYNLTLSRNRAEAVAAVLAGQQVDATRFTVMGYGESQPHYDNATAEGRAANRRVDLAIMANDKLKKVAKDKVG